MLDNKTIEIYKAAKYIVELENKTFRISVGEKNTDIDALLAKHNVKSAFFVTPENPYSKVLTSEENASRHKQFIIDLCKNGYSFYTGYGTNEEDTWPTEISYLIMCDDEAAMHKIAKQYEQNGFLKASYQAPTLLLVLDSLQYLHVN
jgi:hypothetical protein